MQSNGEKSDQFGSDLNNGHKDSKLSLVAQFDDMCRFGNAFIDCDYNPLNELLTKCENMRIGWLSSHQGFTQMTDLYNGSQKKIKELNTRLTHTRFGYGKELKKNEELRNELKLLKKQMNAIKELVLKEPTANQTPETRDKMLLSYLNVNQLETVVEETDESNDSIVYDNSEEDLLNENAIHFSVNHSCSQSEANKLQTSYGDFDNISATEIVALNVDTNERNGLLIRNQPKSAITLSVNQNENKFNTQSMSSLHMNVKMPALLTNHLGERQHKLHEKKTFKSVTCGPCRQTIRFFNPFLCCEECQVICHTHCKSQLTLPCLPLCKPHGNNKRMVRIADFVPQTTGLPMIPALMVHICREIEIRGLREKGIYRKCGSDKDIKELKTKILKSKTGMPSLSGYDIHVLCGVVKQFLRELDEPIVTRILWRDFVRASDQENPDEEKALIMQTVEELPTANRDSLAFLMIHLICVTQSEDNQMDSRSLAKIFSPTVVGYSMIDPPMTEILAENPKQIKVMEALFRIPDNFWNDILSPGHCRERTKSVGVLGTSRRVSNRRSLMAQTGHLTPGRKSSQDSLSLKPLF